MLRLESNSVYLVEYGECYNRKGGVNHIIDCNVEGIIQCLEGLGECVCACVEGRGERGRENKGNILIIHKYNARPSLVS